MVSQKLKIMLIEDNPGDARILQEELVESLKEDLTSIQIDLRWFNLLSTALAYLPKGGFDAILLDMNLPDSSGLDNIDKIRSVSLHIPVIVLSGLQDELTMTEAMQRGAQNYVVKGSLKGNELLQVISDAIKKQLKKMEFHAL